MSARQKAETHGGPVGLESIRSVALRSGIDTLVMLRRLKGLAAKIAKEHPGSPPLLIVSEPRPLYPCEVGKKQRGHAKGRKYFMDRSVAWTYARGLVAESTDESWTRLTDQIEMLRHEMVKRDRELRAELQSIRTLLENLERVARYSAGHEQPSVDVDRERPGSHPR